MDIESMTIDGDWAAVHYRLDAVFIPTGETVNSEVLDLLTVEDGKITSYVEFVDTAAVVALAGKAAS